MRILSECLWSLLGSAIWFFSGCSFINFFGLVIVFVAFSSSSVSAFTLCWATEFVSMSGKLVDSKAMQPGMFNAYGRGSDVIVIFIIV